MTDNKNNMVELDALLAEVRADTPVPPDGLIARITEQASVEQKAFMKPPAKATRPGVLGQFIQALGGWPALSGLATATCAGVWLGISPPQSMEFAAETYLGVEYAVTLLDINFDAAFDLSGEAL
ncbi:MAG: hypothetical protein P1U83_06350 [Roseovarius sp.]|nr:hypothetical protein [Roseovarius sp.]